MTRANVYAGPAGFYLLRGGASDLPAGKLPEGAYEVPILIQDRSFDQNGSLFYPNNRAFFEGLLPGQLKIPFIPDPVIYPDGSTTGDSDVSPIWNPEFFGNTMVVNGNTWPVLNVEQRRYRLRFLNGSDSRFVILKLVTGDPTARPGVSALPFWQIGTEGGFLPAPVKLSTLLIALAERADVIVDFSGVPVGTEVYLINEGPDEPFGGGVPGVDFPFADPGTTGQVMKFVVGKRTSADSSTPPNKLKLPSLTPLGAATNVRTLSLNENESATVLVSTDINDNIVLDPAGAPFGPTSAQLGTVEGGLAVPMAWMDAISENPGLGTEVWEIYNFTADAHPIHVHQTMFQVVNRQALQIDPATEMPVQPVQLSGKPLKPEVWEKGFKDTVISYPGQVARIKVFFDIPGLYVWHCHILSHEDNEMMRPFFVGPMPAGGGM
jgi:FtsP/CotA-like multicopper oxidase with cupredoxin domain